jgi:hypothetical protein
MSTDAAHTLGIGPASTWPQRTVDISTRDCDAILTARPHRTRPRSAQLPLLGVQA